VLTNKPTVSWLQWLPWSTQGFKSYETVLWTERIFYNDRGVDPLALAKATTALVSQIYAGVQPHLFEPVNKPIGQSKLEQLEYAHNAYSRAATFVDSLMAHRLWDTLSADEKAGFLTVQHMHKSFAGKISCEIQILKQNGAMK
jgi:hypothetical protein